MHFCQECSANSITPAITDNLFRSLEERDAINDPSSARLDDDTCSSTTPQNEADQLATTCLVKIIHLVHSADLKNKHQVCTFC